MQYNAKFTGKLNVSLREIHTLNNMQISYHLPNKVCIFRTCYSTDAHNYDTNCIILHQLDN